MEHLKSSGSKIMIEDLLYATYMWDKTEKLANKQTLADNFHFFLHLNLLEIFCAASLRSIQDTLGI